MLEKLKNEYKWLFEKTITVVVGKGRKYVKVPLTPTITDCDTFWSVTREPDASPLILSKEY